jgi:serine/threonine-protein kinase
MDKTANQTAALGAAGKDVTPEPDLTGRTVGDFHILRRLGQGGMGQVYLAEQVSLKRKVALKVLKPELAANPTSLARFKKEAEAVARATHANIVQVYFIGDTAGMPYMALEYVEGRNLREYLAKKGPPDVVLGLSIMRQVASALQRASELGIIHRDIKPENILLTRKGEVKVTDFGLSRCLDGTGPATNLTQSGVTMGTPLYMSPEQVEGRPVDHRTDIYSLGVTCYHMMAGHPPFEGETAFEVALKHVRDEPRSLASIRPDLPELLCAVIHKMMAKDPAQRYQTGRELLKDVLRVREGLGSGAATMAIAAADISVELVPESAGTSTLSGVTAAPPRRRRAAWLFVASVLLAALGGAGYAWHRRPADPAPTNTAPPAVSPGDAEVDRILPQKREQTLRDRAEDWLNPEKFVKNPAAGFGNCLDLALFYLENDRLDDAEKLFVRLDGFRQQSPAYHALGHLGRAITLALRNRAPESNKLFTEVTKWQHISRVLEAWLDDRRMSAPKQDPIQMWLDPALRYWVVRALLYNEKNGVPDRDVPEALLKLKQKKQASP